MDIGGADILTVELVRENSVAPLELPAFRVLVHPRSKLERARRPTPTLNAP